MIIAVRRVQPIFVLVFGNLISMLGACDPAGGAEAIVVDPAGAPVASAHASLYCPAPNKERSEQTDATGTFSILSIAMDSDDCVLTIAKPGYVTQKWPVSAACRSPNTKKCKDKPVRLVLVPAP